MSFYSVPFFIFFFFLLLGLHYTRDCQRQNILLLLANTVFYGYWSVSFLLMLYAVIVICFVCTKKYEKEKDDIFIYIAVFICLFTWIVCKYMNFFVDSFCKLWQVENTTTLRVILPLGISFYMFQALSYVLDVKKGKIQAEKDLIRLAVYISFFPQITSGPIVKAHEFLPQLNKVHYLKKENVYYGIQLFVLGLTKKLVVADRIGVVVDAVFDAPSAYDGISVLLAIVGYSIQIYCDFSGYSDMAIGVGKILDFDLGKNFDLPYLSNNPTEFWHRWHISLSGWFSEYVYIPLGGGRKGEIRKYMNVFITMLLSGIWHGASLTYLVWGICHAIGLVLHKMYSRIMKRQRSRAYNVLSILTNFCFVSVLWVFFRSDSIGQAVEIFNGVINTRGIHYINIYLVIFLMICVFIHLWAVIKNEGHAFAIRLNLDGFWGKVCLFSWVLLILVFMYAGDSAFVYANF